VKPYTWELGLNAMAEYYHTTSDDVAAWNIRTYRHRIEVMNYDLKEKAMRMKMKQ
jgi:hypothetical protein